jgi:peptide/nickel transport system permease protein
MLGFVIRRLALVIVTVLLSSVLVFAATHVLPGDVATMVLGREASQQAKDNLRKELGLDKPVVVQYGHWLAGFARGDWGTSISTEENVLSVTLARLRNSAMLAVVAFLMYVPLGIFLGAVAAWRRNSALDHVISVGSLAFIGLPEFVTAVLLILLFSRTLHWLPASSSIAPGTSFLRAFPSLVLPALTVSLTSLAYVVRMTRAGTAEVLQTDYVRTAYLKGLSTRRVMFGHVLRNSLLPTVTVVAAGVGWLMGGLIVTESVFGYPGLGRLVLFAVQRRDIPLIQATTMLIVIIFALANLAADIVYALLNPRIRYRQS